MLAVRRSLSTSFAPAMSTSVVVAEQGPTKAVEKGYMFKREVKKFKQFDNKVEYLTTKLDDVANLIRAGSLWPMTFGYGFSFKKRMKGFKVPLQQQKRIKHELIA